MMATLMVNKLSRAIVTKALPISRASLTLANNARQYANGARYDRATRQGQNDGLLSAPAPPLVSYRQQQTRTFHSSVVAGQQSAQNSAGANSNQPPPDGSYKTILVTKPRKYVASLELNRPKTKNAFSLETADEFVRVFGQLDGDQSVRCVVLSGNGPDFTSGVDIKSFMEVYGKLQDTEDVAHRARLLRHIVERFQAPFKAMYSFGKPIICVQHGLSLGLAMELAACSDVRLCSSDTKMAIREVLIGIAADVGSLQLMPRLASNQSLLMELIYSGRFITCKEALDELKFVSRVCETKELAVEAALELGSLIARRSPVAVQGAKRNVRFSRETAFEVGLDYNAVWNAAMMQGGDVVKAISAIMSKQVDEVEYDDC